MLVSTLLRSPELKCHRGKEWVGRLGNFLMMQLHRWQMPLSSAAAFCFKAAQDKFRATERAMAMFKALALTIFLTCSARNETDQAMLDQASALVDKYCPQYEMPEIDYDQARKNLELSAGEDNIVYNALLQTAAAVQDGEMQDLVTALQESVRPVFAVRKATPLFMAFLLWIVWHFACWFICCPGCMRCCCCCCQRKWKFGRSVAFQLLLWVSFLFLAGLVIALSTLSTEEPRP